MPSRTTLAVWVLALALVFVVGRSGVPADPHAAHAAPAAQATTTSPLGMDQTPTFVEPFTGHPSGPQPWNPSTWDVQVHSRDPSTWPGLEAMTGVDAIHHGPDCAGPPAAHDSSAPMTHEQAAFLCKDHLMTAIKAGGYGEIIMTPPAMVDMSTGESVISFDTSTLTTSNRDWQDLWITPYDANLALPFHIGDVDLHGTPRQGIHILQQPNTGGMGWRAYQMETTVSNGVPTTSHASIPGNSITLGYPDVLTPDAARRSKIEVRLSATRIRVRIVENCVKVGIDGLFGTADDIDTRCIRPVNNTPATWIDAALPTPLTWTQGVVQLGHHSYNPHKACLDVGKPAEQCPPNTWHWDNVSISPYVPFSIIRGGPRMVTSPTQDVVFAAPAPPDARLRFSAVGRVETSTDGGASWTFQAAQLSSRTDHPEHADNYWVGVPEGTQSVRVRLSARGAYGGPFHAKDFALWSRQLPPPPPTATPTATPATPTSTLPPTPTDVPPTATPTATPVPPTATATPTPVPTNTATPTVVLPTATPEPILCAMVRLQGATELGRSAPVECP